MKTSERDSLGKVKRKRTMLQDNSSALLVPEGDGSQLQNEWHTFLKRNWI
jgi:hypothetical protein